MSGRRCNLGACDLPRRRRSAPPMEAFDRLPPALRRWLAQAALPWSPASARRAWRAALGRTGGCEIAACEELSRIEAAQLRRNAGPAPAPHAVS
ncbi:DUF6525 family protein [Pseudoroseicyclus aestuarii]|uniref:Uncharacterized protein n=1 Tax=Pseudoroseicyclus aestuarii TaxID=1795041 RepID=A0A318SX44_9RHOB|nr:DUF6525 family protein [Pseudoroseicyclus aestuarii]PYE85982.1 hypothetical protein DFP88_101656 [Pseudoroseicyclus aestuarii]